MNSSFKIPVVLLVALVSSLVLAIAQTPDNLILQGRAFLTERDITNANARFKGATAVNPDHQSANALYAASRLLAHVYSPAVQSMLDRLGMALTNRNIYQWDAGTPTDTNGVPIPPNNFSLAEASTFLRTNVLVEIQGASANLTKVNDPYFLLTLSSNETKIEPVTVDYADVRMLSALLHAFEFAIHYVGSLDLDAQLNAIYAMYGRDTVTVEELLERFPTAFEYARSNDLKAALVAFQLAADDYLEASPLIQGRPTTVVRLFNSDTNAITEEAGFRTNLIEMLASLSQTTALTLPTNSIPNLGLNLRNFFAGTQSPRQALPQFYGDGVLLGTLPDSTFGGSVYGLNDGDIYRALSEELDLPPIPVFDTRALPAIRFHALDDRDYALQSSSDLKSWSEVAVVRGDAGIVQADVPPTATGKAQFLRAEDLSPFVRFEGRVVDGETGAGIPGAAVGSSIDATTTATDQAGRFVLRTQTRRDNIGSYVITVSSSSYGNATLGQYLRNGNEVVGLEIKAYRPPVISQQPNDATVRVGASASFSVIASAAPPPTFIWQRDTKTLAGNSSTFHIPSVKLSDAGDYSVTVSSAGGSVRSRISKLVVLP